LLIIFPSSILISQSPDTLWTKTIGGSGSDAGYSVKQTSDGGFIISGKTSSFGTGNWDVYLIKTDMNGDTMWTKTFGGNDWDEGNSVLQNEDGDFIIAGSTNSFGAGNLDVYLIKTDENGDTLWTKTYGGASEDIGYSVEQTTDDGLIITGSTKSFGAGYRDVYLIKTDENGDTLWTKTYGGMSEDIGYSVEQTIDDGFIIVGYTKSFGAVNPDVYLIKTDENGDTLWTKTYGGVSSDYGYSVKQTTDAGFIITGKTMSYGAGDNDVYLIRTDSNGDTLWTNTFGSFGYDAGSSVQQTIDGGFIIVGQATFDWDKLINVYLIKTDRNGIVLWVEDFGGSNLDGGSSIQQTTDGGFIIAGWTASFGQGSYDVYLIRTSVDPTKVENSELTQVEFYIAQNYPNPFNPSTIIKYTLGSRQYATLKVYDVLGNEVATLVNEDKPAGSYEVNFSAVGGFASGGNAYALPSGVYFYQLRAGNFVQTKKMLLLR